MIGLEENNRLYVFDDLFLTVSQLANCLWELDSENKPVNKVKDEARWHLLAALRYVGSDFTPETSFNSGKPDIIQVVHPRGR